MKSMPGESSAIRPRWSPQVSRTLPPGWKVFFFAVFTWSMQSGCQTPPSSAMEIDAIRQRYLHEVNAIRPDAARLCERLFADASFRRSLLNAESVVRKCDSYAIAIVLHLDSGINQRIFSEHAMDRGLDVIAAGVLAIAHDEQYIHFAGTLQPRYHQEGLDVSYLRSNDGLIMLKYGIGSLPAWIRPAVDPMFASVYGLKSGARLHWDTDDSSQVVITFTRVHDSRACHIDVNEFVDSATTVADVSALGSANAIFRLSRIMYSIGREEFFEERPDIYTDTARGVESPKPQQ